MCVTISLDAYERANNAGVVDKIYPQKTVLSNGDQVYRVDVKINNLPVSVKLGQSGTVLIKVILIKKVILVRHGLCFTVQYWVSSNGKAILKKVSIGEQSMVKRKC